MKLTGSNEGAKPIDTWQAHWGLLHLAAQLDQQWAPRLQELTAAAIRETFSIAQKLGVGQEFTSLGEMREVLLAQIIDTGATLVESAGVPTTQSGQRKSRVEEVFLIARTLDRSVDMRSGKLTANPAAQHTLWSAISTTKDYSEPPRQGLELIRCTCGHVLSQLEAWRGEERALAGASSVWSDA